VKEVNCYLCGSEDAEIIDVQDFDDEYLTYINPVYLAEPRYWNMCRECGFVYHNPRLDEADVEVLYQERYRRHSLKIDNSADEFFDRIMLLPKTESENYAKVSWLKSRLERHFDTIQVRRTVLDIGCSAGMFLKLFTNEIPNWDAVGVEPTQSFAEVAARRVGVPIKSVMYQSGQFNRCFDLITVVHVLEHIIDPGAFLREVRCDLAESGVLFIEVPYVSDFGTLPMQHDRFMCPHLYYFSESTAERLLARSGFVIIEHDIELSARGHANLRLLCAACPEKMPVQNTMPVAQDASALRRRWRESQK